MTYQDSIKLIEDFLSIHNSTKFSSPGEQLAYERGVLTAALASLVYNDTYARSAVVKKIKRYRSKNK